VPCISSLSSYFSASTMLSPISAEFLAPTLAFASASSIGSVISYAFNNIEKLAFNISSNQPKVGVAGAAQQRFLERVIFNGIKELLPNLGYIAPLASGTASSVLSSIYSLCGIETNIHKNETIYKNSLKSLASHTGSQICKLAFEQVKSIISPK
jgi:hypothetical protein